MDEEDSGTNEDESSLPELIPKTSLEDEESSDEEDSKKYEEEELDCNSDNEDKNSEFRSTYRDKAGLQVKLEKELWIKEQIT